MNYQMANGQRSSQLRENILESSGFLHLTMDGLAHKSGVTRQTIHNLFGTKDGVLEALFDQIAMDGGMERMRNVMQQTTPRRCSPPL